MSVFIALQITAKVGTTVIAFAPKSNNASKYVGTGRISGLVRDNGTPAVHRVNLHARPNGTLVASMFSDSNGRYSFKNISKEQRYYIVCLDEAGGVSQYPALVQDMLLGSHDETLGL